MGDDVKVLIGPSYGLGKHSERHTMVQDYEGTSQTARVWSYMLTNLIVGPDIVHGCKLAPA